MAPARAELATRPDPRRLSCVGVDHAESYVDYYTGALTRDLPPLAAGLVAGVLLIVLIRRISTAQDRRIERGRPVVPVLPAMIVPCPLVPTGAGGTIST